MIANMLRMKVPPSGGGGGTKTFVFVVTLNYDYGVNEVVINGIKCTSGGIYTFNNMSQFTATVRGDSGSSGNDWDGGGGGASAFVNSSGFSPVSPYIAAGGGGGGGSYDDSTAGMDGASFGNAYGGYVYQGNPGGDGSGYASGFTSVTTAVGGGANGLSSDTGYSGGSGGYAQGTCNVAGTYQCVCDGYGAYATGVPSIVITVS